jgi:hypothetical protein
MKPEIYERDCFTKKYLYPEGQKPAIKPRWKTIFNNDISALKYCLQEVSNFSTTLIKFSDPEFGATGNFLLLKLSE